MVLTQGGPLQMLLFLVFIIVLQQIEGNLIYPKVVGNSVGLPGIWVLAAVTVGGSINGVFGMLIGVPLAATIYRLLGEDSLKRIQKRKKRYPLPAIFYRDQQEETEQKTVSHPDTENESTERDEDSDSPEAVEDSNLHSINQAFDEIVTALDFREDNNTEEKESEE